MTANRRLTPALIYAALTTSVVSSLGMLLVPSISGDFGVGVGSAQWMLTINLMVGAVATPVMGRLSDGRGTRRLLMISLAVILVGSVVAATAPTFGVFLIGRALQGLSYGIVPVTIVLARRNLPRPEIDPAISSLSVTVATGLGIGYPLTGVIASVSDFRAAFWFAAVFVATAMVVVWMRVPSNLEERSSMRFDVVGAALLSAGLATLLTAVSQGPTWGWLSVPTLGIGIFSVLTLIAWGLYELRSSHPLINLHVVRQSSDVLLANATAIGLGTTLYMSLSIASIIAQAHRDTGYGIGLPLFWAGFVMLPLSAGSLAGNRFVRRLSPSSTATMLPAGSTLMAASAVMLALTNDALWEILLAMALFGLGMGAAYAAMPTLIARNVAISEVGSAVSFNQVLRTVGGAAGSAVVGAILAAKPGPDGIDLALAVAAAGGTLVCAALLLNMVWLRRGRSQQA